MTHDTLQGRLTPLTGDDPRTIGSYTILGVLGSGGMGVVYFAEQERPKRSVAIKVLRPATKIDTARQRFELEAELLGRLQHAGIAQIFEASTFGERHYERTYLAMEYVDGEPLTDYARAKGLDDSERVELLVQLADAVHHAHQRGVLHRDLKPGNVLVTAEGRIKVIDFGIARMLDEGDEVAHHTREGEVIGTLTYMSPQQIRGEVHALDTRVDVYAMGVLAYELLAGAPPFDLHGWPFADAVGIVCERDAPLLGKQNARCRGDLEAIVAKCLEKEPERRYPSASALAADLRRFLAGEAVQARAPSTLYQLSKFARRNRALVIGTVTTVAALAIGLIGTVWGLVSARNANRELESSNQQLTELNEDLERVSSFQAEQLSSVDVNEMAVSLRDSILEQAPTEAREPAQQALSTVNFVDVAQESLERNVFRPSMTSIDRGFSDQPLVRAQLLQALTDTAIPLGLLDIGRQSGEEALAIRRDELGVDDPVTQASMLKVSEVLRELGEYDEAEAVSRDCLETRTRLLGPDDVNTLAAKSHLGAILLKKNELDEAEALFRDVLAGLRGLGGAEEGQTQRAALNLTSVLYRKGQYEEAEPLAREAFEWRTAELGPVHPDTLTAKESLSNVLDGLGRVDDAIRHARDVVEGRRAVLGNNHPYTASSMSALGTLLQRSGQRDEAAKLFREAYASERETLGDAHPSTMMALARMADAAYDAGDFEAAEEMYRRSWEGLKQSLGPDHTRTHRAAGSLGMSLSRLGRYEEAEPLYWAALENAEETLGPDHPGTLTCLGNVGVLLSDMNRMEESLEIQREVLERRSEVLGPSHPSTLNSYYNLAYVLQSLGELDEAEPLLRHALENYTETVGPDSDGALFSAAKLAEVQLDRGQLEEAEALFRDVYERRGRAFSKGNLNTLEALDGLCRALRNQGKWSEIEELLLARHELCKEDDALEQEARGRLVVLYSEWHTAHPEGGHDRSAESWRSSN